MDMEMFGHEIGERWYICGPTWGTIDEQTNPEEMRGSE
jgi:hypothetical protein